jgi:hypothetical protein
MIHNVWTTTWIKKIINTFQAIFKIHCIKKNIKEEETNQILLQINARPSQMQMVDAITHLQDD